MATLLIVEDDHKTNEAICEYLKPTGHMVIPAYDGGEASELFAQNSIDLVVLDIMLMNCGMLFLKRCFLAFPIQSSITLCCIRWAYALFTDKVSLQKSANLDHRCFHILENALKS